MNLHILNNMIFRILQKIFSRPLFYRGGFKSSMDIQEACIKFMVAFIQEHCAKEIALLGNRFISVPPEVAFPRVTFKEAQEIYFKRTGHDEREEPDLSPAAEKELCNYALENFGTSLIFITDWKTSKRPFYSYPNLCYRNSF